MGKKQRPPALSPRHQQFVDLIVGGMAAGAAYLRLYKCAPGTAETKGPALVRKGQVRAAIDRRLAKVSAAVERREIISRDEILRRLRKIGLSEFGKNEIHPPYGDQVRALAQAVDLLGLRVEEAPHPDRPINDMSREERQRRIAELLAKERAQ